MKNKFLISIICFSSFLLSSCGNSNSSSSIVKNSTDSSQVSSNVNKSSDSSLEDSKNTYTITFKTNSTQIIEPLVYEENQIVYLEDLPVLLDRTDLSAPKFVCWTNENIDVVENFIMPNENIELIAKWREYNTWKVKYETGIDDYCIEDTIVSEKYGLESYSFPLFSYPYKNLKGWYYDSAFTQEVGATLDENLFINDEIILYSLVEDTDVSSTDTWQHRGDEYIGRGYTQVKNIDVNSNKTTSVTVNLPAYNKEEGCYGVTEIYFGGDNELINNGSVKSGYALFICGLDDSSAPVNGYVDPRAGSMALYKYNKTTNAREMLAACRRYVEPLLSSSYTAAYENYISNGSNNLQIEIDIIIGEVESYIQVMGTKLFTFDYKPDGNGFGFYTNASYPTATYFSSLLTNDSGTTTIKFDVDGGKEEIPNSLVTYGNTLGTLPTPTKDNASFLGWTLDGNIVNENYVPGLIDSLSLKAKWGEVLPTYDKWDGSIATQIAEGSGTEGDPYIINSSAELAFVSQEVNANNSTYRKAHYKLEENLDLNNIAWTPIGNNKTQPFQGTFDGNDKVIIGMNVSRAGGTGLFGNIADAYILNVDITGTVNSTGVNSGILVGRAQLSTISNCETRGTLTSTAQYTGAIAATINAYETGVSGTQTKMIIENCTNYATVSTTTNETNNFIGGILAQYSELTPTEIKGCVNRGNVTGTSNFIGGIISIARKNESSIIKDCYNFGNITSGTKSRITGGIAGASRARIENCYGYESAKVNNLSGNHTDAQLYPTTNGTTVPGGIICGQWDAAANCTSNSGFFNCGMCDIDGNKVAK